MCLKLTNEYNILTRVRILPRKILTSNSRPLNFQPHIL